MKLITDIIQIVYMINLEIIIINQLNNKHYYKMYSINQYNYIYNIYNFICIDYISFYICIIILIIR